MCFFNQKTPKVPKQQAAPDAAAEPADIGSARQAEDEALFGGIPDLRVDRSATGGGVDTGTGLQIE